MHSLGSARFLGEIGGMTKRPRRASRSSGTVLVVDHDHSMRKVTRRFLVSQGYQVLDASNAADAEQIAKLYVGPIHLLLVEADLPRIGGRGLAARLRSLHPALKVLSTSSRPQSELIRRGKLRARMPFIPKPFVRDQLAAKIREVLGYSR